MKNFYTSKHQNRMGMKMISKTSLFVLSLFISVVTEVKAQQPVGRIVDQVNNQTSTLHDNGLLVVDQNPANRGYVERDPSGFMYLRVPAINPFVNAYFIGWDGRFWEIDKYRGTRVLGYYEGYIIPNPAPTYQPPNYNTHVGVQTPTGFHPLPDQIVDVNKPYGNIMITTEQKALQCYEQSLNNDGTLNKERFGNCMIQNLAGNKELEILDCIKNSQNSVEQTMCMIGILGGDKEKEISQKLLECYNTYGTDYSKYALCLAGTTSDPELSKLLSCIEQQSRTGQVSFMNTAICYGVQNLNLNPETQIILECAIASGGEPYTFAGCAGGQLLARELDKCLTYGIGGEKGCFGKNNEIIKGLAAIGEALNIEFGPNNDLTKTWNNTLNDIKNGPGENHEVVKAIRNISNEIERTGNNVKKEIKKVFSQN